MDDQAPLELPSHQYLSRLARDDPSAYEALRCQLIENFIDHAPEDIRRRLRGLQFRIDGVRSLGRSPLGSTLRVYRLMWESFSRLNEEIADFRSTGPASRLPSQSARVIEFRRPEFGA